MFDNLLATDAYILGTLFLLLIIGFLVERGEK